VRRLPLVLAVFLLGAAPAAEAGPSGRTLTVRNFGDSAQGAPSRDPGPPGSLRHILKVEAKPGDRIVFERPGEVALTAPIIIPADLHDIQIVGASGTGRAGLHDRSAVPHWRTSTGAGFGLIVEANNVRIEGLTFTDTPLVYHSGSVVEFLRGGTIRGNLFNGRHGYLIVGRAVGVDVTDNEFAVARTARSRSSRRAGFAWCTTTSRRLARPR
jgi:hypothetical protein